MNLRKLNAIYFYCLTLIAGISISSCSDDDMDSFLEASTSRISLDYNGLTESGNNANFEIGSNGSWKITSHDQWITLNHIEGERGRTSIFLTVEENLTGSDRDGSIVIEGSGITQTVSVSQKLKVDVFSVSPTEITVTKSGLLTTGERATIDLTTNSNWNITEIPEWITADKMTGKSGSATITLSVLQNKTAGERTGEIKIVSGSLDKIITVTQNLEGLKTSISEIRVNKTGTIDGTVATFDVTATSNWTLSSDSWIHADKANGEIGKETITLTFDANTGNSERTGKVTIHTTDGLEAEVSIVQTAKTSAYEDDGKAAGFVYMNEDFDWCRPFGGQDQVADKSQSTTIGIYGSKENEINAKAAFDQSGIQDLNPNGKCMYLAQHYLKMGKGNNQTGIVIPQVPQLTSGKSTDIELTFDVAPNIGGGGADAVTITVEITQGPGSVNNENSTISEPIEIGLTTDGAWAGKSVKLYGLTDKSQIVIRSTQQGVTGYFRWFLDNVKMVKATN
ncbi:BACON domain-containing protein [Bacteroides sp.]|uniref:BACON domain-containing protein n=1 Tax=Bacteroides sp. TaxID=29523 RepID=UPI00261FDF62|nr:BACON domain-containing protein [Bacteroides sp.]MDD3039982.1 BACON domain-containing protein [Bacteroides sp.]